MSKELSGAAGDVLHALFFRGALVDGDLPSKAGTAELRELGYVMTQDTVTPFGGEHHFNFLTPSGQAFAISYLADSRFGKQSPMKIKDGQVFINDAFISCTIAATTVKPWEQTVEDRLNELSANLQSLSGRDAIQAIVGRYLTGEMTEYSEEMIDELMALHAVSIQSPGNELDEWRQEVQCRFDQQSASLASLSASISEVVKATIEKELQPGGLLYAFRTRT
ncbi:TPA: hypothetical protein I8271_003742 [Kluyvera intermedia]|uniref:Uncharacterized protein n=1 Tax=Kluyvera intermedia TaxID=61648 RepID=A0A9P3WHI2_KLUIN|nr:hypothetical protein [Phytobacter ursingii]HAT2203353.1 hypothetical protein [Kluyvera intermedia]HAT2514066.1 hypothetical protein [Kluyvera intermedia]HAT2681676.1 hypothetical protein [Kluyvera intermedia]HAT2698346.1 hypothetical protein [Kluyvera intermedia]HAT2709003.1 hypothetical protein [Kluyvera intermedia]